MHWCSVHANYVHSERYPTQTTNSTHTECGKMQSQNRYRGTNATNKVSYGILEYLICWLLLRCLLLVELIASTRLLYLLRTIDSLLQRYSSAAASAAYHFLELLYKAF
jgi:hypothetical protein